MHRSALAHTLSTGKTLHQGRPGYKGWRPQPSDLCNDQKGSETQLQQHTTQLLSTTPHTHTVVTASARDLLTATPAADNALTAQNMHSICTANPETRQSKVTGPLSQGCPLTHSFPANPPFIPLCTEAIQACTTQHDTRA